MQFARSADGGYAQFAIKFFLRIEDYQREKRLYSDDAIRRTLPELLQASDNTTDALVSRHGYSFPPYLVRQCSPALSDGRPMLTLYELTFLHGQ